MEVHHHSHPEGKKIRHYLFEFLMLFLAVSAGFFVENIREHFIEKKRARGLAVSLIKDMQKDTAQISWLDHFGHLKEMQLDSMYDLLDQPFSRINSRIYYDLAKNIQVSYALTSSNGTINQLKNAGYLRYFSNDSLPGLLSEYDFLLKDNEGEDVILTDLVYNKYYTLLIKTSDSRLLHLEMADKAVPDSIGITQIEAGDLKALRGIITVIHRVYNAYKRGYYAQRKKAEQIIEYLRRSLHLK